jgi:hypothetical protein
LHAVEPLSSWKVPAAHDRHVSCSDNGLYVPGAQSVALALPTEQWVPFGQMMHSSTLVMTASVNDLRRPAGQGSAAAAPVAQ